VPKRPVAQVELVETSKLLTRCLDMTRFLFRTIDVGASIVFMAFCARAFGFHFYEDIRREAPDQPDIPECTKS
jgi:hypothetical protein